jgi:hypothetical protein
VVASLALVAKDHPAKAMPIQRMVRWIGANIVPECGIVGRTSLPHGMGWLSAKYTTGRNP